MTTADAAKQVPFVIHQSVIARMDLTIKRLWVLNLALLAVGGVILLGGRNEKETQVRIHRDGGPDRRIRHGSQI